MNTTRTAPDTEQGDAMNWDHEDALVEIREHLFDGGREHARLTTEMAALDHLDPTTDARFTTLAGVRAGTAGRLADWIVKGLAWGLDLDEIGELTDLDDVTLLGLPGVTEELAAA